MTTNYDIFLDYARKLPKALKRVTEQDSYSYRRRKTTMFKEFTNFVSDNYPRLTKENCSEVYSHFRSQVYSNRGENSVITANSNYLAWASLMRDLIRIKALPGTIIPKGVKANHPILKQSNNINCLGSMNPQIWKESYKYKDMALLQASPDQEYLEVFIEHQINYRDKIVALARNYIKEALNRFLTGQHYISITSPSNYNCPNLLHPNLKAHRSGQRLSLFSDRLPNKEGLKNLVGYIFHIKKGMISRDFKGSNNHLYRFGGRTVLQEHLGLSSNLASACAIIIICETGINPESLYRLDYDKDNKIIKPHDKESTFIFNYQKPRAGGSISRLIKKNKHNKINTEFCLTLLEQTTEFYRRNSTTGAVKKLFIHDSVGKAGEVSIISSTAFKSAFKRIISKSDDLDLILSKPSLSKLRVTGGIIAWYESGGDPRASSKYLGNSTSVSIKNYIPKELQEFFYRKQIREFQNLLIAVATDNQPYQAEALNIKSQNDLHNYLENHIKNSDLYKRVVDSKINNNESKVTFILSENNIAFLNAAKNINNPEIENKKITKKWKDIASIIFSYIRTNGTRRQQHIMKRGIDLYNANPLELDLELS